MDLYFFFFSYLKLYTTLPISKLAAFMDVVSFQLFLEQLDTLSRPCFTKLTICKLETGYKWIYKLLPARPGSFCMLDYFAVADFRKRGDG